MLIKRRVLIVLIFLSSLMYSEASAQSKKLFTDVYWEIPLHGMSLLIDSNIVYCVRHNNKINVHKPPPPVMGFVFYSNGKFLELVKGRCARDRNAYSGNWVQSQDTISVKINDSLFWYFKIDKTTSDVFVAKMWYK